ncbi:hypothetical protein GCM10007049_05580 [Echinicola pacifica]|uniref:Tetratricopeptide repeat-containing protein n=2 Tax=Echinicola pacifica TaxID=346377 RepID=A0A918PPQ9_9BACT|nr:hypothetical protein GCM10007049_05580 [Echinicola pacifica]
MGKNCKETLASAQKLMDQQQYNEALTLLNTFSSDCKTKDAKEQGAVMKAEAYNQVGNYDQAITQADLALKVTKNRSLAAHFQKGIALQKTGDIQGSQMELKEVITLTEKNQNTPERAKNYALMARVYDQQLMEQDSADWYLEKAISLDPSNTSFLIQKGDMKLYHDDYQGAYAAYDQALAKGHDAQEVYISRSNTGLKEVQQKYGTDKTQDLRKKMSAEEKTKLCKDINQALELGWRDMNMDMFSALICK